MRLCTSSRRCLFALFAAGCLLLPADRIHADGRPQRFRAGAATADITPEFGVSLNGAILKSGPVKSVHDRLHTRALVLNDRRTPLAVVVCGRTMSCVPILFGTVVAGSSVGVDFGERSAGTSVDFVDGQELLAAGTRGSVLLQMERVLPVSVQELVL